MGASIRKSWNHQRRLLIIYPIIFEIKCENVQIFNVFFFVWFFDELQI